MGFHKGTTCTGAQSTSYPWPIPPEVRAIIIISLKSVENERIPHGIGLLFDSVCGRRKLRVSTISVVRRRGFEVLFCPSCVALCEGHFIIFCKFVRDLATMGRSHSRKLQLTRYSSSGERLSLSVELFSSEMVSFIRQLVFIRQYYWMGLGITKSIWTDRQRIVSIRLDKCVIGLQNKANRWKAKRMRIM